MTHSGAQAKQMLQRAAEAAASVAGDPVADEVDGWLPAPEGAVCALCKKPLLPQQNTRRGPTGLRHESCP